MACMGAGHPNADTLRPFAGLTGANVIHASADHRDERMLWIHLRNMELLLIDQRGWTYRPMAMAARMEEASFKPAEAPKPSQSLTLKLDYCLR